MKGKTYFFLFIFFFALGFSQNKEIPPAPAAIYDSIIPIKSHGYDADSLLRKNPVTENNIYPKKFRENFRKSYTGAEFDYSTVKPRESLLDKIRKFIRKILDAVFGKTSPGRMASYTEIIIRVAAVVIIGFVLYFLIRFLLGRKGNFFFGKKNPEIKIADSDVQENIHEINFKESISAAEMKKDYRSAVRYRFLSVLKLLSDKKLIVWNSEKTNADYMDELTAGASKDLFRELVYIFDYVWYGEFDIDETSYEYFKKQFVNFK